VLKERPDFRILLIAVLSSLLVTSPVGYILDNTANPNVIQMAMPNVRACA